MNRQYLLPLALVTLLFFMWGAITSLNDILVPLFKDAFQFNHVQSMLVQTAFFGAYFLTAIPGGALVGRIGLKRGMVLGLLVAGAGCLLFLPASYLFSYNMFLLALFVLALGVTLLQVSANPYVSMLGAESKSSARLNLAQAFNSLGHTVAPALGTLFILAEGSKAGSTQAVEMPYLLLALAFLAIALVIRLGKLPEVEQQSNTSNTEDKGKMSLGRYRDALREHPALWLGILGIFFYVGAEVAIGSILVSFFEDPSVAGMGKEEGGYYVSFYWGGAMVGRFLGAALLTVVKPHRLLQSNALAVMVLLVLAIALSGQVAMWAVIAVGFFNSVMFANIFTMSIKGMGKYTPQASGLLISAIVGGAIIPPLQGAFADALGIRYSFLLPLLCYGYILYFGSYSARKHRNRLSE